MPQKLGRPWELWLVVFLLGFSVHAHAQANLIVLSGASSLVLGQAEESNTKSDQGADDASDSETEDLNEAKVPSEKPKAASESREDEAVDDSTREEKSPEVEEDVSVADAKSAETDASAETVPQPTDQVREESSESVSPEDNGARLNTPTMESEQADSEKNGGSDEPSVVEDATSFQETWPTLPKSGLRGWGLGIDVPMSGILTGNATSSSHGVGYTLGLGLGYEVVRGWVVRLALTGGETSRGEATIQYLDGGIPLTRSFEAEWLGVELGIGLQRIFKDFDPLVWPYVGIEAGPVFSGYYYRFDSAAVSTLATNDETTRYGANEYEAVGLGWAGKLSGGIRLELMPGIEWGTEYSLSVTTVSEFEPVSNTRQIREVFPIQEWIFQHRLIIGLWLGL